jgi:DNA repair protein RecO (recombination protein O)
MRQPHLITTEACVLKRMDYGEADRILTLFTPHQGKLRAIAKGARRTTSRLAGHVELFARSQLQLASGRELAIVTQGELREPFPHLRGSLWHATTAYYLAELLDKFTEDHSEHRDLYTLLMDTLRRLDADAAQPQSSRAWQIVRYFELHLLGALVYQPALHECASCSATLGPVENGFNATLGGVLCPNCSRHAQRPITLASFKVLRLLQTTPWDRLPQLRLEASQQHEVEYLLQLLIRFHLERDLKSWEFLRLIQPL